MSSPKNRTPLRARRPHFAVLDVGTSKVACFIAQSTGEGNYTVTGIGHQLSRGIKGGHIIDIGEACTSIVSAVHAAEQMAGVTLDQLWMNVSGACLDSQHFLVELSISGAGVSEQDMRDVLEEGYRNASASGLDVLHAIPMGYTLDGARGIRDPRAMIGSHLGADLHMVSAKTGPLRNLELCVARAHLNVNEFIATPYASGLGCLEADEMDLGVTVLDLGGGTTAIGVFNGGKCVGVDSVPIGGGHITSDIAKGLSTSLSHAERLKILNGSAMPNIQDERVMLDVPQLGEDEDEDETTQLPRSMLNNIIRPRAEEWMEMVAKRMEATGLDKLGGRRVVLTGGASQLTGMRDLATKILGKQVRLGRPHTRSGLADAVSGPAFTASLGMIEYILTHQPDARDKPSGLGKLFAWMGKRI